MKEICDDIYQAMLELWGGKATPEQIECVREWLRESPKHVEYYNRLYRLYCGVNYAEKYDEINVEDAKRKLLGRLTGKKMRVSRLYRVFAWSVSVAACLFAVWLTLRRPVADDKAQSFEVAEIVGGQAEVTLVLGNGQEMAIRRDSAFALQVGEVNLEQVSGEGLRYMAECDSVRTDGQVEPEYNIIKVPRGGEYMLTLEDGTKVWLNAESELKFPVRFAGETRKVEIVGEGYFEVAKDVSRPFVVCSGEMEMRVLGTSFNVKAYRDEEVRAVTLVSGKVRVSVGAGQRLLSPGWQATWNEYSRKLDMRKVDVSPIVSWRTGMFDFVDMPLEELVAQLGRWYDVDFFFVNESIKDIHFTGAVKRSNTLKFMLDFVSLTSDVRYEIKGKTVCLYRVN